MRSETPNLTTTQGGKNPTYDELVKLLEDAYPMVNSDWAGVHIGDEWLVRAEKMLKVLGIEPREQP